MEHRDWGRIQEIYDLALSLPPAERSAVVARECHDDPTLASEVNELLQAHDSSGGFLQSSFFEMGMKILSNSEDDLVGQIIDERYRVEQVLAEGGMGKLYLAADLTLHDQPVVLKVLSQSLLLDADAKRRFQHEIHALTLVKHPKIVSVLDAGELPDGKPYVVMEYIDGVTLRSQIPSRGMDLNWAAWILKEIGAALGHIHKQGIVHRDLKPENIMIQVLDDGTELVKIVDFGIAKIQDAIGTRTLHNTRIGTEAYMSPEQLRGDDLTPAIDIYAMSVVAYEMINGHRPPNPASASFHSGRLSRRSKSLVLRGLSAKPADRPPSAKELGEALYKALRAQKLHKWITVIGSALGIALLSFGIYWWITSEAQLNGFDYWLTVQSTRDGKDYGPVFKSNGNDSFEPGDKFQLNILTRDETGYIYVFSEGTSTTNSVSFRLRYPKTGLANVGAKQTVQTDWDAFRGPPGAENFWIVWSVSPVPELEKAINKALVHPQAELTGEDLVALKEFLTTTNKKINARDARYKDDNEGKVSARSDIVLTLTKFEHR